MTNMLKISEAASLALHAMVLLAARSGQWLTTPEIVATLKVSQAHLSKVMQRLGRAGLVKAVRGPKGGFQLGKPAGEITLLEVYEAIDGPVQISGCLYSTAICNSKQCIFGDLIRSVDQQVRDYLAQTTLPQLTNIARNT